MRICIFKRILFFIISRGKQRAGSFDTVSTIILIPWQDEKREGGTSGKFRSNRHGGFAVHYDINVEDKEGTRCVGEPNIM